MKTDEELDRLMKMMCEEGQKSDVLVGFLFLAVSIFGAVALAWHLTR